MKVPPIAPLTRFGFKQTSIFKSDLTLPKPDQTYIHIRTPLQIDGFVIAFNLPIAFQARGIKKMI